MSKFIPINQDEIGGVKPWLILLTLVVFAGGAGIVWFYFFRPVTNSQSRQVEEAKIECHSDDNVLCEYLTSWKEPKQYRYTIRETTNSETKVSVYEYDLNDPPRIYARVEGGEETITIGDTIYTKWDGFWAKKTINNGARNTSKQPISKPSPEDAAPIEPHNYKKIGQEKCGELTCYKYKITDPENPGIEQFIWFDSGEYKLRQLRFKTGGTISEQVFEYVPVKINEPSPVRDQ